MRTCTAVPERELEEIVNTSITQTLTRSIYTSFTTFVMVAVLYIMGVSSIREFAAPLMVGILVGAYSSVCITGASVVRNEEENLQERHSRRSPLRPHPENLLSKPKKARDVSQKDPDSAEEEKQKESS